MKARIAYKNSQNYVIYVAVKYEMNTSRQKQQEQR